ncbi:MAG: exosortase/archaeosortase family protein [Euryarchaeota archaeon]|nr:exosortase/archaeosortase family protein [Euryarchaeota archaeon]
MKKITILLALLLSLLYLRTFIWLSNTWFTDPVYSHGVLIPIISLYLAWRNVRDKDIRDADPSKPGMIPFTVGILLYTIGAITIFPFLSAISFLFVLCGLILYLYGKEMMNSLLFPVLFLIFAIPIPVVPATTSILQSISSRYSALTLEMLGVAVIRTGSELQLRDCSFSIGLPCSGMNTLISLLAVSSIFIYLLKCPPLKKAALFCMTIPVAIVANIIRITAIILIADHYGVEVAMKFFHDFSSPFLFIIAFIFLIILSRLMRCRIREKGGQNAII